MLFNSFQFLLFFPLVTVLYFVLPHKTRWFLLLAASIYFYMSFVPKYILILALTIVVDYFAGIYIEKTEGNRKKLYFLFSIWTTIAILFVFKYFNFFNSNAVALAHLIHWNYPIGYLKIILPIGLSFHTFQSMAYIIEVYRGNQKAEKHFGIYALYVMFYPQLVAGPIERPQNLLHQFYEKHEYDTSRISSGLRLMLWGFIKKIVIADRLALYVDEVYHHLPKYHGWPVILAVALFAFQIYCDFSGYSDIALGTAKVMGFRLMLNFNHPFASQNISEFWRRWHISLSTWFNDYLFTPLSMATRDWGRNGLYLSIFITFFLAGVWHGAGWTFIIYGCIHGVALIYERATKKTRKKWSKNIPAIIYGPFSVVFTFVYVSFSFIFFRSASLKQAGMVIRNIWPLGSFHNLVPKNVPVNEFVIGVLCVIGLELVYYFQRKRNLEMLLLKQPYLIRWSIYNIGVILIVFWGVFGDKPFIYFQF